VLVGVVAGLDLVRIRVCVWPLYVLDSRGSHGLHVYLVAYICSRLLRWLPLDFGCTPRSSTFGYVHGLVWRKTQALWFPGCLALILFILVCLSRLRGLVGCMLFKPTFHIMVSPTLDQLTGNVG